MLNSDSGDDSIPEDDPDSVVVEFIDFIKVQPSFLHLLSKTWSMLIIQSHCIRQKYGF